MRMLLAGPLWGGSTSLQRLRAFQAVEGLEVRALDSLERVDRVSLADRVRHRLRLPKDKSQLNRRLISAVEEFRPDVVFVDATRVVTRATIRRIRREYGARAVFYFPDDASARHNSSRQLEACDHEWDIFFTTKDFNVPELRARGVRRPILVENAYDPVEHRPMDVDEVGPGFEEFDSIFIGTYEGARLRSINQLAEAGVSTVVYGNGWNRRILHPTVELRPPAYAEEYTRALHTGKLALGFLRKMNRDTVTHRSVEVPAAGRPMVAEKTTEHDKLFVDGREYVSFSSDAELIVRAKSLLADDALRIAIGRAARQRCVDSGYSTLERAKYILRMIEEIP